ncbi:thioredoxin-disulfide reductase [soil metagenome]
MKDPTKTYDVVIIGGGPAGLSAAIWCADLGLDPILIEKESEFGGQLRSIFNPIVNYPAAQAANGSELADAFIRSANCFQFDRTTGEAVAIDPPSLSVEMKGGRRVSGRAIVLATGVSRRRLGILGETEFQGKGVLTSGAKEREWVKGKRVVIVGGGDAAMENAVMLGEYAAKVFVVHRRAEFTARGEFMTQARDNDRVEFVTNATVESIEGGECVEQIIVRDDLTGESNTIEAENVLIRIGVEPNSQLLRSIVELDPAGYVKVNTSAETSLPGIYAVGDVANPVSPTISTAAGTAATAVKSIFSLLEIEGI